ncbi:MAG: zinc-binding dehydrogenase [Bacteroidetes bacterium]|nr:zinc-binding dehydrogenase [Bacteroidota bacterium]
MKAAVLVRTGDAAKAFEIREVPVPKIQAGEVLIKVEGFGLNFADVVAREGMYQDAPPIPAILGYDVVGRITEVAPDVQSVKVGDRVTALTRFGGYAEYAVGNALAIAKISDDMPIGEATALTTQYCTAYYAAAEAANIQEGDRVLIHSAAGGVGTALVQYARYKKCEIFATAGSESKLKMLQEAGVHHAINYQTEDFEQVIRDKTSGVGVDAIFDAVGGSNVKKGFRSLIHGGGRIVCYGASTITGQNIFGKISTLLGFGLYHPIQFMSTSRAIIGVNMLRIADNKPTTLARCLKEVVTLHEQGIFKPLVGGVYPVAQLAEAHAALEGRKTVGKITVTW